MTISRRTVGQDLLDRDRVHRDVAATRVRGPMITDAGAKGLALLRIALGAVFLWAFLDKTFGLGFATPSERRWIEGGSPTRGFLASVQVGPLESLFHDIAGTWWADVLFMAGLLAIGIAMIAGVAMRAAAVSGALMMALMWAAEFPPARHASDGSPTGSSNPLVDYHAVYAVALIVLALTYAGSTWGLGARWARVPFVAKHPWAR